MSGKKGMKGGGRPKAAAPRVTMTIRVAPETAERVRELRECGFKAGRFFDEQIGILWEEATRK